MSSDFNEMIPLLGEAVLLLRDGRTVKASPAAMRLFASSPIGRSFEELFSQPLPDFREACLSQARLEDGEHGLRLQRVEGGLLVFLSPCERRQLPVTDPMQALLRDILTGLSLSTERVREQAEDLDDAQLLDSSRSLSRSQFRLNQLLGNLSVAANMLEGKQPFTPAPCPLTLLVRSVLEAVRFAVPELRIDEEPEELPPVPADAALLKQMLFNLISNSLHAGAKRLSVRLHATDTAVTLSLRDDGCGIDPEQMSRVFDRYSYDFQLSELMRGPGLGLSVARGIAWLHGGRLVLESRPGEGTAVHVSLPRRPGGGSLYTDVDGARCTAAELFTGLADCLPLEAFDLRQMD